MLSCPTWGSCTLYAPKTYSQSSGKITSRVCNDEGGIEAKKEKEEREDKNKSPTSSYKGCFVQTAQFNPAVYGHQKLLGFTERNTKSYD